MEDSTHRKPSVELVAVILKMIELNQLYASQKIYYTKMKVFHCSIVF